MFLLLSRQIHRGDKGFWFCNKIKSKDKYFITGTSYFNLDKYDEAIKDFDSAINLNPKDQYSFYYRGRSYFNLDKYDEAIKDFDLQYN